MCPERDSEILRENMISRVSSGDNSSSLPSTMSGSNIARAKFHPTVDLLNEVSQGTLPALLVLLMTFPNMLGIFWFGDLKQLQPTILMTHGSEVA